MATVMVVDDSAIMRRNLTAILTQAGHTVVAEAVNGGQAHLRYRDHQPDLVTMDITMPGVNGIEAVKLIIRDFPEAKIIMVSALDQRSMVLEALQSGAKHYIVKPISADSVISIVNKVLQTQNKPDGVAERGSAAVPVAPAASAPDNRQEDAKPFAIANANGVFRITLHPSLNRDTIGLLEQAVQGLLYVEPLSVLFGFVDTEEPASDVLERVGLLVSKVKHVNGQVRVISSSQKLVDLVRRSGVAGLAGIIQYHAS